ncbi:MAG TPA: TerB family tellurite resistance protein [Gemmatimonadales bacterium]
MLDAIRRFVTRHIAAGPSGPANPEPGTGVEQHQAPGTVPDSVKVAACALLLEVAHADGEFTPDEQARIEDALARHFGLDEPVRKELIALAEAERRQSIDHFQFTRLIRDHYDLGQKVLLAELMWTVILSDGKVADHEAYLVRKLASLLELPPAYLAQARHRAGPPGPEQESP